MRLDEYGELLDGLLKSSVCKHENLIKDFDYEDGWPMFIGATCEDCGTDLGTNFTLEQIAEIENEASADMQADAIDSAVEYDQDRRMGLI